MPDVIVTGLPRAGSAVVSAIIDSLPDALSLNFPIAPMAVATKPLDIMPYCKWLVGDFVWTRRTILDLEPVSDYRGVDGRPLLDGLYDPRQKFKELSQENSAEAMKEPDVVYFTRSGLSNDFILAMRHHSLFTSILPTLVKFRHFKIIAVIRHPLDVLSSWQQLAHPVLARGTPPSIARFWPEALAIMESGLAQAERYAQLYEAYLGRYHELRDQITIVKYEDVIDDVAMIGRLFGGKEVAPPLLELIEKSPKARITAETKAYREAFRKFGVFTKHYYPDIL